MPKQTGGRYRKCNKGTVKGTVQVKVGEQDSRKHTQRWQQKEKEDDRTKSSEEKQDIDTITAKIENKWESMRGKRKTICSKIETNALVLYTMTWSPHVVRS